ncbi:MAG TPA: alpha-2-macroglobulin family protein [Opitutaceae bacterium]|nr:alpha-2-macroglobulin family protein [Opitutaceae bacterium]
MINSRWLYTILACVLFAVTNVSAGPRDAEWKAVDEAKQKALPKTEAEHLESIYRSALADKAYAEATKALCMKFAAEASVEGSDTSSNVERLQQALKDAPSAMRPVMEAILAYWYWDYFKDHRWQVAHRTATSESPGADFRTWDLSRLLAEIDAHFSAAVADANTLKATPVADFNALIEPASVPDKYRPTLYDFLVHQALQFYQAGETAAVQPEDDFEIEVASPIFADASAFLKWKPETKASSFKLKAVTLLQDLMRFHEHDADRSAYFDADLARIDAGVNLSVGDGKEARYVEALLHFADATVKHPISAIALSKLAQHFIDEGEPVKAHDFARRGYRAFSESAGGVLCFNLLARIEAKVLRIETESVWSATPADIQVTYRNIERVHCRVYAADFEKFVGESHIGGLSSKEMLDKLMAGSPAAEWEAPLPATRDWAERTATIHPPTKLKPGFYFLVASRSASFARENNMLALTPVWVSNLAIVVRNAPREVEPSGLVVNAETGEPIENASLEVWINHQRYAFDRETTMSTDKNGAFHFEAGQNRPILFVARHGGDVVSTLTPFYFYRNPDKEEKETRSALIFTDRAIYRPGQIVNYKGVALSANQDSAKYETRRRANVTVTFSDTNGREIARASHVTNDYGSFAGSFTAPQQGVTGVLWIKTLEFPGTGVVRVEEYKRPRFQVELAAPNKPAKLNEKVEISGNASGYSGASVSGAQVKWRVERRTRFPVWLWWIRPVESRAIAHGAALTADDGHFNIAFDAAPDPSAAKDKQPTFEFVVHADVTDTTGETRSQERTVVVGYTALQASVSASDFLTTAKPIELSLSTSTLDGQPQAAQGKIVIYRLEQPERVVRPPLPSQIYQYVRGKPAQAEAPVDATRPETWKNQDVVANETFTTKQDGTEKISVALGSGPYRAVLTTTDAFGNAVSAELPFTVFDPQSQTSSLKVPNFVSSDERSYAVGETFTALWGTGYESGRAFVEIERDGKSIVSYWTKPSRTQERIDLPITENMRGGFTVGVTFVRENRAYFSRRTVEVPWSNKTLSLKWGTFRSKLLPGQKETWTASISDPDGKAAPAEMVATLYDASLDQFAALHWPAQFSVFRTESSYANVRFSNEPRNLYAVANFSAPDFRPVNWQYRRFPEEIIQADERVVLSPFEVTSASDRGYRAAQTTAGARMPAAPMIADFAANVRMEKTTTDGRAEAEPRASDRADGAEPPPDLASVAARKNLNETAFFFPQLVAGKDGVVKMEFTMPEALTRWRFLGFAHDRVLRAGLLSDTVVTSKDLMVLPNPPRFLREGDVVEFTVKVSNQSEQTQRGKVRLTFADAVTEKPLDEALSNRAPEKSFEVPAKQSRSYAWRLAVPDGLGVIRFKAVAASEKFSDGEENFLPVLSRRIAVTESLPLPLRGPGTKTFEFEKLIASANSTTLQSQSLSVQMVSQPAWYAVLALPYLMEYPYECSEQIFNRLYANQLAQHIATSDPKIRRVFDLWKTAQATDSPLEKNQEIKSVLIEETPWLRDAKKESEQRKNVGLLFDENRLESERARAWQTLLDRQGADGLWSWFPGGGPSEYITLYIATGFGRMRHLGMKIDESAAKKAWAALDEMMQRHRKEIAEREKPDEYVPSSMDVLYLYGRSFFLEDLPLTTQQQEVADYFLAMSHKHWTKLSSRQSEAQLAIAFSRFGDETAAAEIMRSLKERSTTSEELGMYWKDNYETWWWYNAPIETQAVMIEAFSEVAKDAEAVEACKVWLLKQKQTQQWPTTKATADAVYALLLQGRNLLASDARVEISLGGKKIVPEKTEAGTGYYEQTFVRSEITPEMGHMSTTKTDDGVSWGSVHWQYLEDVSKVTPHEGTPLTLKKILYVRENTSRGPVMKPVNGPIAVGDEVIVRIELRTDRDMEFVHLKDQRGSGTEPVNVLSRYKYQDGLGYYESTRDTATHFFIDYLKAGTYVFEYPLRVQLKGRYQSGIAEVQCMYAPEFNSHSASTLLEVK